MPDKESLAVRFMHTIDKMLKPSGPSKKEKDLALRRQRAEESMDAPPKEVPEGFGEPDDIADQILAARRRRKVASFGKAGDLR